MKDQEVKFQSDCILVSKTDIKGHIIYANEAFIAISGYSEKELLGKPHNIVRHEQMPKVVFKLLWDCIQKGKEMNAYFMNKTKRGGFYWVYANTTASRDANGNIIAFHSTRTQPEKDILNQIKSLYETLLSLEVTGGLDASEKYMNNLLKEKGVTYEEFILSI